MDGWGMYCRLVGIGLLLSDGFLVGWISFGECMMGCFFTGSSFRLRQGWVTLVHR